MDLNQFFTVCVIYLHYLFITHKNRNEKKEKNEN